MEFDPSYEITILLKVGEKLKISPILKVKKYLNSLFCLYQKLQKNLKKNHGKGVKMKTIFKLLLFCFSLAELKALQWDEIILEVKLDTTTYHQGYEGVVTLVIKSKCPDDLKITWVGINFEWVEKGYYYKVEQIEESTLFLSSYGVAKLSILFLFHRMQR